MKKLMSLIILVIFFSCKNNSEDVMQNDAGLIEKDYWRHLKYLVQIKNDVAELGWKGFSKNDFLQPAVYYTHEGTFVVNPNEHIQTITHHQKMKSLYNNKVIKLSHSYTDTTNFNFNTSYNESDSSSLYFQENVLNFQSFDLTSKLIGVTDLQDWAIMVIHELFHGYQREFPEFKAYYSQLPIPGGPDKFLAKYHKELKWYEESVYEENELLKAIWLQEADLAENFRKYDSLRTVRIDKIRNTYGIDIREVEDYEILIEGHARYFESLCKRHLAEYNPDISMLQEEDLNLISNMFEGYDIKKDKALYNIYNDRYYYPLGYNISMILEKHLPEYKESIYVEENNFNRYIEAVKSQAIDGK